MPKKQKVNKIQDEEMVWEDSKFDDVKDVDLDDGG